MGGKVLNNPGKGAIILNETTQEFQMVLSFLYPLVPMQNDQG